MEAQFKIGSYVRYAASGICLVEDITAMTFPGSFQKKDYYVLKPTDNQTSAIYVPMDNEAMVANMLPVPTREEIEHTIRSIRQSELAWIEDRKERSENHKEILRRCDRRELLILAGSIYVRRQELAGSGRKLAGTDESTLRQAERLINNELGFVLGLDAEQTGAYIRELLAAEGTVGAR